MTHGDCFNNYILTQGAQQSGGAAGDKKEDKVCQICGTFNL